MDIWKMHYMRSNSIWKLFCCICLCIHGCNTMDEIKKLHKRGVMDNFNEGLKYAGQMFGINTAADVANLVAKAFSTTTSKKQPNFMSIFQQQSQDTTGAATDTTEEQQVTQQHSERNEQLPPAAGDFNFGAPTFIASVLRMIGFDASKLGALALNAIIMIAQVIGNTLLTANKRKSIATELDDHDGQDAFRNGNYATGPEVLHDHNEHQPRKLRDGTPIDWFLENPTDEMRTLLHEMNDRNLTERITHMIASAETEQDQASCLKLFMCKSAPFIWGMQKSLAKRLGQKSKLDASTESEKLKESEQIETEQSALNTNALFTHFPSLAEYREHGRDCEALYASQCNITQLPKAYKRNENNKSNESNESNEKNKQQTAQSNPSVRINPYTSRVN